MPALPQSFGAARLRAGRQARTRLRCDAGNEAAYGVAADLADAQLAGITTKITRNGAMSGDYGCTVIGGAEEYLRSHGDYLGGDFWPRPRPRSAPGFPPWESMLMTKPGLPRRAAAAGARTARGERETSRRGGTPGLRHSHRSRSPANSAWPKPRLRGRPPRARSSPLAPPATPRRRACLTSHSLPARRETIVRVVRTRCRSRAAGAVL